MIPTVLYVMTLLLWAVPITLAYGEELPDIELPEYIITGAERATLIKANRLEKSDTPKIMLLPPNYDSERPTLSSFQLWEPPIRPDFISDMGIGYWSLGVTNGGFGLLNVTGSAVRDFENLTIAGYGWYDRSPQHTEPGNSSIIGFEVDGSVRLSDNVDLKADVGISQRDVRMLSGVNRTTTLATFNVSTSPVPFSFGNISFYGSANSLKPSEDDDTLTTDGTFRAQVSNPMLSGWLESNISISTELENDVNLFKFHSQYHRQIVKDWFLLFGGEAYSGSYFGNQTRSGAGIDLGVRHPSILGGEFAVRWKSGADYEPVHVISNRWNIALPSSSIIETSGSVSAMYYSEITELFDVKLSATKLDQQHVLSPVLRSNQWYLEPRRLQAVISDGRIGFQLNDVFSSSLSISSTTGTTSGSSNGDEIVQVSPLESSFSVMFDWSGWVLTNELQWQSSAPIDFERIAERPERFVDNIAVKRSFSNGIGIEFGIANLLDNSYYDFPGYDQAPLTMHFNLNYRSKFGS